MFKEFSSSEATLASPEFREHLSEFNYGSVKETSFPKQGQCLKVTYDRKFPFLKTRSDNQGDLALNGTFWFTVRTSYGACSCREPSRIPVKKTSSNYKERKNEK